jgi:hypothetical protein
MRAVICRRWIDARAAALQGQPANPANSAQAAQLQLLDASLSSVCASQYFTLLYSSREMNIITAEERCDLQANQGLWVQDCI